MVGGNPLVSGDRAQAIQMDGAFAMGPATAGAAVGHRCDPSHVVVDRHPAGARRRLARRHDRARCSPPLSGGPSRARSPSSTISPRTWPPLSTRVHSGGQTLAAPPSDTGVDFFSFAAGLPAALGLKVAITDPNMVAAANGANGTLDGSVADHISQLREGPTSPDAGWRNSWSTSVSRAAAATRNGPMSRKPHAHRAENLQTSNASVDVDEEMTNMLSSSGRIEGSARVLTAIDSDA